MTSELEHWRARAIAAEHHRMLELLGKGSATEQLEMELRTKVAEAELIHEDLASLVHVLLQSYQLGEETQFYHTAGPLLRAMQMRLEAK